jgi:hypothetical protein
MAENAFAPGSYMREVKKAGTGCIAATANTARRTVYRFISKKVYEGRNKKIKKINPSIMYGRKSG